MKDKQIGLNVEQARRILKLSQVDVADKMADRGHEWTQTTVYRVEKGKRALKVTELVDLARVLNTSTTDLLREEPLSDAQRKLLAQNRELLKAHAAVMESMINFKILKDNLPDPDTFTPEQVLALDYVYTEYRNWYKTTTLDAALGKVQGFHPHEA